MPCMYCMQFETNLLQHDNCSNSTFQTVTFPFLETPFFVSICSFVQAGTVGALTQLYKMTSSRLLGYIFISDQGPNPDVLQLDRCSQPSTIQIKYCIYGICFTLGMLKMLFVFYFICIYFIYLMLFFCIFSIIQFRYCPVK